MKQHLTDAGVRSLPLKERQYEVWDSTVTGLAVRVSPGGRKSFNYVYRFHGQSRRMTLGAFPKLRLAAARELVRKNALEVANGVDPQKQKMEVRSLYASMLYSAVADQYIELYAKKETRSWTETSRILHRREIADAWHRHTIDGITKSDVAKVIDAVREQGPSAAFHAFADLRRFFNWCKRRGYVDRSPCDGMEAPSKAKPRSRVLTDNELKRVWVGATRMGDPFGPFVQMLILTLQRRREVAGIRGCDLEVEGGYWLQRNNKSDREHKVFLSEEALNLLQPRMKRPDDFLFQARGADNHISGFSKWKKELNRISGVEDWCLHDLRRTATTRMSQLGVPLHVCELILNHSCRELSGIAGVYNRNLFEDEQRKALAAWGKFVAELVSSCEEPITKELERPLELIGY